MYPRIRVLELKKRYGKEPKKRRKGKGKEKEKGKRK